MSAHVDGMRRLEASHSRCLPWSNERTENKFWSAVVSRADVRNVGLVFHQNLRAAEVTELQDARSGVQKQILRLDVSVADTLRVNVGKRTEELVDVELDLEDWHRGLELVKVSRSPVYSLGDKFEHQVEIDLIFLRGDQSCLNPHFVIGVANPVSVGVVECLELHNVGMADNAHNLQFSILCTLVSGQGAAERQCEPSP